jgi:hypothetical protein
MLNQLTEKNLEMWKDFQNGLVGGMGRPAAPRATPGPGREGRKRTSRRPDPSDTHAANVTGVR